MECSSIFFPIRVKEEVNNESTYHDAQASSMPPYYSAASQYFPQMIPMALPPPPPPQSSVSINKQESLTPDSHHLHPSHHHHHHHPHQHSVMERHQDSPGKVDNGEMDSSTPSSPPGASPIRPPLPPLNMGGFYNNTSSNSLNPSSSAQNLSLDPSSASSKYKRKKKKKVKEEQNSQMGNNIPQIANNALNSKKHMKQEKITDAFKVRKKVDRFNGMPEEEVIKRTLPDHLAPDLDILIIGINPGLFAAFKGHHYAGPGNHFWKCLYLSGLIPDPMTADDDYKLIELGIGFTNIVNRTTKGSADLNRKEIREGAQVLQEKIQRYRPKIAVFNGKGIYEVFSGKKNFDFGKQPEPIEGTNSTIYVMPSSSARCAQLPRAVDKVPFYVALKKLRDHVCGRLPALRDSEVCFPDVKLKIESEDGLESDIISEGEEQSTRQRVVNLSANSDGTYSVNRSALPPTQRNFHQHPLGRAALAAAAAAGGYLDETLARAGLTRSGESLDGHSKGSLTRKYKCKKKKAKDDGNADSSDEGSRRSMEDLSNVAKKIKIEKDARQGMLNETEVKMENVQQFSDDYHRLHAQGGLCPPPIQRPNPQGTYSVTYPTQFPPSPSSEHSPLYGSPLGPSHYQHPHIKQEKIDLLDPIRGSSPSTVASSSSLISPYSTSVGCLYGPSNPITGGYGPPQPTYYGAAGGNPYGTYHPSFGPPSPFSPQLSPMNPHHPLNQLAAGTSSQVSSQGPDLFGSGVMRGENGFHHLAPRHPHHHIHSAVSTQHQMANSESQYYSTASMASSSLTTYTTNHTKDESSHSSSLTAPGAFHQYPSPPSSSPSPSPTTSGSTGSYNHPHLLPHQTTAHLHPMAQQYCPTPNDTTPGPNFDSSPPLYANLENVKVKQERMDNSYGEY